LNNRVDFSQNAKAYDRRHGAVLDANIVDRIARAAGLSRDAAVVDVGAGTGRVAIAMATTGRRVVAIDPARPMLDTLRSKAEKLPVRVVVGEGARLPLGAACADAVVLARTMYLMPDWGEVIDEALRVLKLGGRVLHEWGNGSADEDWVKIREKLRSLFEAAGVKAPFHPGARSEEEVHRRLMQRGVRHLAAVRVGGSTTMTLRDFVRRIVAGEFSYTWAVPEEVQRPCLSELERWAQAAFDLDRPAVIPRDVSWNIYGRGV
jgi:SAM-dependent methyltransferase